MRRFVFGFIAGVVLIPAVVFMAGWFGFIPTTAKAAAPRWETAFAHRALDAAAARHAGLLRNPIVPSEANLRAGMTLFKDNCAGCHGLPDAHLSNDVSMYPDPPYFAAHRPTEPDWQLFWIVKYGVRYSAMFAWAGQMGKDSLGRDVTDEKIWTVVTFLSHLDSLPPSVAAEWHSPRHSS